MELSRFCFESWPTTVKSEFTVSLGLALLVTSLLCACGEEQQHQQRADKRSGLSKPSQTDWLAMQDDVPPEVWLVGREEKAGIKLSSDEADGLRRSLSDASARFKESPRMVVNHAAQLEEMLRAEGGDETAVSLIATLTDAVAPGRIESFGAAGQQYYNMRKAGFSSRQALNILSKRYGSRS